MRKWFISLQNVLIFFFYWTTVLGYEIIMLQYFFGIFLKISENCVKIAKYRQKWRNM